MGVELDLIPAERFRLPTAAEVGCSRCPSLLTRTNICASDGAESPALMVVGEAPGADEDAAGVPFVGRSGRLLRASLAETGITADQIRYTNAVRCRPEGNRDPSPDELANCRQWLEWEILQHTPRAILAVGRIPTAAIIEMEFDKTIPEGVKTFTAYHPAYILRNPKKRSDWQKDQLAPAVRYALGQVVKQDAAAPEPWYEGVPEENGYVALDTETDDLEEGYGKRLACWQISDGVRAEIDMPPNSLGDVGKLWFHNVKYDAPLIGLDLRDLDSWEDTGLIAYVLRYERVGMEYLAPRLTGMEKGNIKELLTRVVTEDLGVFKSGPRKGQPKIKTRKEKRSFSEALAEEYDKAKNYALSDAVITSRMAQALWPKLLADPKLLAYYRDIEKPCVPILQEMEARGVLVDPDRLIMLGAEIDKRVTQYEGMAKASLNVDEEFNLGSNDSLSERLLATGLPLTSRTATGRLSVDEQSLLGAVGATTEQHIQEMLDGDQPSEGRSRTHLALVRDILKTRELRKLKSTYVEALLTSRDSNSRIHAQFNQMVTNTNRLSSSKPNLQNIPARDPLGKTIREAFIAPPGHVIVKADYSQLEVRIYAALSQERVLVESYPPDGEERDCHQGVADALGIPRKRAKNVLFATLYGASAPKLAATAGIPLSESGGFLARMRQEMPTLLTWQARMADEMTAKGYVETLLGWRGYFPTFWSPVQRDQNEALREMANFPIQGTAAGIVKRLMIEADTLAPTYDAELVLQVHDEVVYEVPECHATAFCGTLEALGAQIGREIDLTVPLKLNVEIGPSWGNVRDWREWISTQGA